MKTYSFLKSDSIPDYVNERDVFGLVKSKRTSMIKRLKFKPLNAPELDVDYAGLGVRTLATFIDLVIIAGLMLIPELLFFSFNFHNIDFNSYRFLMFLLIWIVYHVAFESTKSQATPGKRIFKLKIIDLYGNRMSIVRTFFRCLVVFISIAPIGLGIWYISTDSKKQGWHDLIAGTYVIKSEINIKNENNEIT
jgi:uncharacterized RDD family membrane protein YckC